MSSARRRSAGSTSDWMSGTAASPVVDWKSPTPTASSVLAVNAHVRTRSTSVGRWSSVSASGGTVVVTSLASSSATARVVRAGASSEHADQPWAAWGRIRGLGPSRRHTRRSTAPSAVIVATSILCATPKDYVRRGFSAPIRRTLFGERSEPFQPILCRNRRCVALRFEFEPSFQVDFDAARDGNLCLPQSDGRRPRNLDGQFGCDGKQLGAWRATVNEPDLYGAGGVQPGSRKNHLLCARDADNTR